jgi:hypothetical protein
VAIIGSVLTIGIPVGVFFGLIKPEMDKIAAQKATYDANSQYVGPAPLNTHKQALQAAVNQVAAAEARWDGITRTKNPDIDLSDRFLAWRQLTRELEFVLGPSVEHWLPHTGIQPLGIIYLDAPSPDPNAVPPSVITVPLRMAPFPTASAGPGGGGGESATPASFSAAPSGGGGGGSTTGSMNVLGTFPGILHHIESWNKFSRIVVIDNVSLSGYSPIITGSYNATVYIFTTNGDKEGTPVPSGAATTTQNGLGH